MWGSGCNGKWVCIGQLVLRGAKEGVDGRGDLACREGGRLSCRSIYCIQETNISLTVKSTDR